MLGCKTVLLKRKLVPDQKASRAVPWRASLMVGRATLRVVASKATARVRADSDEKASRKSRLGLHGWPSGWGLLKMMAIGLPSSFAVETPVSDSVPGSLGSMMGGMAM
jgi:hypothetical protein